MIKKISLAIFAAIILTACPKVVEPTTKYLEQFLQQSVEGIYIGENDAVTAKIQYDEDKHQLAVNQSKLYVRIQTDGQDNYANMKLAEKPTTLGAKTTIDLSSGGISGLNASKVFPVTLEKIDGSKMWLWNNDSNTGFIVSL